MKENSQGSYNSKLRQALKKADQVYARTVTPRANIYKDESLESVGVPKKERFRSGGSPEIVGGSDPLMVRLNEIFQNTYATRSLLEGLYQHTDSQSHKAVFLGSDSALAIVVDTSKDSVRLAYLSSQDLEVPLHSFRKGTYPRTGDVFNCGADAFGTINYLSRLERSSHDYQSLALRLQQLVSCCTQAHSRETTSASQEVQRCEWPHVDDGAWVREREELLRTHLGWFVAYVDGQRVALEPSIDRLLVAVKQRFANSGKACEFHQVLEHPLKLRMPSPRLMSPQNVS